MFHFSNTQLKGKKEPSYLNSNWGSPSTSSGTEGKQKQTAEGLDEDQKTSEPLAATGWGMRSGSNVQAHEKIRSKLALRPGNFRKTSPFLLR